MTVAAHGLHGVRAGAAGARSGRSPTSTSRARSPIHERVARILAESPEAATQADADSRDGSWLPLQYCARCKAGSDVDRLTTATLLLAHGADPATALDQACWADNGAIADLLLERGARLRDDDTPNHLACDGQLGVLESLLRHDAIDMNGTRGTCSPRRLQPAGLRGQHAQPAGRHLVPGPRLRSERSDESRPAKPPCTWRSTPAPAFPSCACWWSAAWTSAGGTPPIRRPSTWPAPRNEPN